MQKTKIEWCDFTWNPVIGCMNKCPYCYARSMARRFAGPWAAKENRFFLNMGGTGQDRELETRLREFKPTWMESNWIRYGSFPKKPSRIFVNSMSDIAFWKRKWMDETLDVIRERPQHIFLFLTKSPEVYGKYPFPKNCWLGATATTQQEVIERQMTLRQSKGDNLVFLSIEPIQEHIDSHVFKLKTDLVDWIIIGQETGSRRCRVRPSIDWIDDIVKGADNTPVFLKNNLKIWYRHELKEFPEERP